MKIFICQKRFNPGDIDGNVQKIKDFLEHIHQSDPEQFIAVLPEMAIPGYPALDLYQNFNFIRDCKQAENEIALYFKDKFWSISDPKVSSLILGNISMERSTGKIYNSAVFIDANFSTAKKRVLKKALPEYDIFWEHRYFDLPEKLDESDNLDKDPPNFDLVGRYAVGVLICEEQWVKNGKNTPYNECFLGFNQTHKWSKKIVVSLNASPYYEGKPQERYELIKNLMLSSDDGPELYVYANCVGGQDGYEGEVLFDGNSFILKRIGNEVYTVSRGKSFEEDYIEYDFVDTDDYDKILTDGHNDWLTASEKLNKKFYGNYIELSEALIMGIRDYLDRVGMDKVVLGLSGGIDSALTAYLLSKALPPQNVMGISMPSDFSSKGSVLDSRDLAKNLGIDFKVCSIADLYDLMKKELIGLFDYQDILGLTLENIQARIRGNLLMAYSNENNALLITTGNKTELALGYCTMYGDMSGGLAAISDLNKIDVNQMCSVINQYHDKEIIPYRIIDKEPSAELSENQTDENSLGASYEVLSPLVEEIVENNTPTEILEKEYPPELVGKIRQRINQQEYKRRQCAPGIKVKKKSFGGGRMYPWSHNYME